MGWRSGALGNGELIWYVVCRFIGVSDLAAVRFSLPAQLLEPTPNLGTFAPDNRTRGMIYMIRRMGVDGDGDVDVGQEANLMAEYWNYLDRPETFIAIGDSDEPLGRMLGTLRFWFTKDLVWLYSAGLWQME